MTSIPPVRRKNSLLGQMPKTANMKRRSSSITFGGFDHYERTGQLVDPMEMESRPSFPKGSPLNEKMRLAHGTIISHEPYQNPIESTCRSASALSDTHTISQKPSFITRHNPVSATQFKQDYSKRYGSLFYTNADNMKMHYSTNTLKMLKFDAHRSATDRSLMWKKASKKDATVPQWALSSAGRSFLMGSVTQIQKSAILSNDRPWTTPALGTNLSNNHDGRRNVSRIGKNVDLLNRNHMGSLARTFQSRQHPFPEKGYDMGFLLEENIQINKSYASKMLVTPSEINLENIYVNEIYQIPLRIQNVGARTDRFRMPNVNVVCDRTPATIANCLFDREKVVLAPGLSLEIVVELCFTNVGEINGALQVETRAGTIDVNITGSVGGPENTQRPHTSYH